MDFRRLEAFCKVYERRSFSRAGEELFLSQPTISAHIQTLEKELGARLFDRMGRSVLPTPAGNALYSRATDIFRMVELAKAEVHGLMHRITGEVTLGASTIPAGSLLPSALAGFVKSYPDVSIRMETGDSAEITDAVAEGRCMLGVAGARPDRSDLVATFLRADELVCVAAPEFPRVRESLSLEERLSQPWVMREPGSGTRLAMEQALSRAGKDARTVRLAIEVASTQALLACAVAGMGLAITSRLAAAQHLLRGELVETPLPALRMEREFWCITHSQRVLFPAAQSCLNYLMTHCGEPPAA
ncbi:selenium metabolism-associated LysR family transcriptional regulator [Megalodesulfovibrio paquesii]